MNGITGTIELLSRDGLFDQPYIYARRMRAQDPV